VPERVQWVDGPENPAESFHDIAARLVQEGLTDEEIGKALGATSSSCWPPSGCEWWQP
jgi:membrane dipeptidase